MTDDAETVQMTHGSGGRLGRELVESVFGSALANNILNRLDDAACLEVQGRLAFTIDGHVVSPLFFPGGDIGRLSVTGTVNDLAVMGATPLYIALGVVIEEGFPLQTLRLITESMRKAAGEAGVEVVTGDTKVVERGAADGVFITTSGIGLIPEGVSPSGSGARPGDAVVFSGTLGDHGAAILSRRQGLEFDSKLKSDCAPLNSLVREMLAASARVHAMRDPTRGGLAAALNEIAAASEVAIEIEEETLPVKPSVRAACELFGLDPLLLANEGKLVAFIPEEDAGSVLAAMRSHPLGAEAAIIGRVVDPAAGAGLSGPFRVFARTVLGGLRIIRMPAGEQLPRIC